jgi:hypothetical protein
VGKRRTYFEVGEYRDGKDPWSFSSMAPVPAISAHRLTCLIDDCRDYRERGESAFLVYWPYFGDFLRKGQTYGSMSESEQKAFERECERQSREYI